MLTPKEKYSKEQFERDLKNPGLEHIKDRETFKGFYDRLGEMDIQKTQKYKDWRMKFIYPKGKIIELGCHAGFDLIVYAKRGFEITGVDISTSLLELAKGKISQQPEEVQKRITLINSFIEDLPEDKKYDTIILTETLEHVQNPVPVLKKAKNLLAKNGRIFISTPSQREGNYSHVRGISPFEMHALLNIADFTALEVYKKKNLTFAIAR